MRLLVSVCSLISGALSPALSISFYANFLFRISLTAAGLAWPRDAFITCPTRNPITAVLPPRYCSTCLGLASKHVVDNFFERAGIADLTQTLRGP